MKRVVVKIGTQSLTDGKKHIQRDAVKKLVLELAELIRSGKEMILVTSGAVAMGRSLTKNIHIGKRSSSAVGQPAIMALYKELFGQEGIEVAQILLGQDEFLNKEVFLPFQETINELLSNKILPIINENDALTNGTQASFGDNDALSAKIAISCRAECLIILSHVNGLYTDNPEINKSAKLVPVVEDVNHALIKLCSKKQSEQGSGGMISKLNTARLTTSFGIKTIIANAKEHNVLMDSIYNGRVGTTFVPRRESYKLKNRDRWILSAKISSGSIVIDEGAIAALRRGKSLLAVGIKRIFGTFKSGRIIEVLDAKYDTLAVGIINTDDRRLSSLLKTKETYNQEVIHTDNMIVL